ncbi:DUF416 family protein [Alishewanella longhuensis]
MCFYLTVVKYIKRAKRGCCILFKHFQQDPKFINVAKISQATVARLIEYEAEDIDVTTEAELKKIVRDHPLMHYEMDCLAELIELVRPMHPVGRQQMQQLKAWVKEQGLTNLAMELPLNATAAPSAAQPD